jgi:hypothetical protein
MSDDAKPTHAIDYLEPWSENGDRIYARLESRPDDGYPDGGVLMEWKHFGGSDQYGTRAVACVNACTNIADPSAVPELVEQMSSVLSLLNGLTDSDELGDLYANMVNDEANKLLTVLIRVKGVKS